MTPGDEKERPGRPAYRVYRSRRGPLRLFQRSGGFRDPTRSDADPDRKPKRPKRPPREPSEPTRPAVSRRRVVRWLLRFAIFWILLSIVLFLISAQIQMTRFDGKGSSLEGGINMVTKGQTILVLGSDRRSKGSREPGADTRNGRADTIMLLRVGAGKSAKLSIPRDSFASIPGFAPQKINAAFAFGGAALEAKTVEQFMGIKVNHVIEIDFDGFRQFIDALGGVRVHVGHCVVSRINGGFRNGGFTLRLQPGTHTLNGKQALALARTRKNACDPSEDDRTRARRQQLILAGVKSRLTSPARLPRNFLFAPWLAWTAPRALISDMGGLTMSEFVLATIASGNSKPRVLRPSGPGPGGSLLISPDERRAEADHFLKG